MTTSNPAMPRRPVPIPRSADWLILALTVVALLFAWAIRQEVLGASKTVGIPGVRFAIPARSIPMAGSDQFAATTPDGLTVRASQIPAPAIGTDLQALSASRSLAQAQTHDLYRTIATTRATVQGKPATVLEYVYVNASQESVFASPLQVIHGYEMLYGQGSNVAIVSLEGPDSRWQNVQELWPALLNSIRFSEVSQ